MLHNHNKANRLSESRTSNAVALICGLCVFLIYEAELNFLNLILEIDNKTIPIIRKTTFGNHNNKGLLFGTSLLK